MEQNQADRKTELKVDPRELLFDRERSGPITLKNEAGKRVVFAQVYATEMEEKTYCILRPLDRVEGMGAHSALAFCIENGEFHAVRERALSEKIFAEYFEALKEAREN